MSTFMEMQPSSRAPGQEVEEPSSVPKPNIDFVESMEAGKHASYVDTVAARLSKSHRDYLMERHGTLDLDPIPGLGPADPLNWPEWKVGGLDLIED